jgi:hypothetical protein
VKLTDEERERAHELTVNAAEWYGDLRARYCLELEARVEAAERAVSGARVAYGEEERLNGVLIRERDDALARVGKAEAENERLREALRRLASPHPMMNEADMATIARAALKGDTDGD